MGVDSHQNSADTRSLLSTAVLSEQKIDHGFMNTVKEHDITFLFTKHSGTNESVDYRNHRNGEHELGCVDDVAVDLDAKGQNENIADSFNDGPIYGAHKKAFTEARKKAKIPYFCETTETSPVDKTYESTLPFVTAQICGVRSFNEGLEFADISESRSKTLTGKELHFYQLAVIPKTCESPIQNVAGAIDMTTAKNVGSDTFPELGKDVDSNTQEKGAISPADSVMNWKTRLVKPAARVLKFPPCDICSGKASGLHYGCNTCEACKNFFRRYLLRNQRYKCSKDNNCMISSGRKSNCSECRLTKCLRLGMSKDKSKMGRYSYSRRTETIRKVRKLEGKDDPQAEAHDVDVSYSEDGLLFPDESLLQPVNVPVRDSLSDEENKVIKNLIPSLDEIKPWGEALDTKEAREICLREHHKKYMLKMNVFGTLNNALTEDHCFLRNHGVDIDEQFDYLKDCVKHWDKIVGQYCKYTKNIPGFSQLPYSDQECLLKSTHFDFFILLMHQGYDADLQVFLEINGMPYHIDESADKFFSRAFIVGVCNLYSRLQRLNISKEEMVLLTSIVTLSCDNCEIQNVQAVNNSQEFVTNILVKLLKFKYGQVAGIKKFAKYVDCLLEIRSLRVTYSKEYSGLCQDKLFQGVFKEDPIPSGVLQDV